jgi:DNA-binding GntR family transcriptional regulator
MSSSIIEQAVASAGGTSNRVSAALLRDLEMQRLVPGQRLIETDLAQRFGVGRNAVREAIQWLAAKGVVDLSRNRSPSIRHLSLDEVLEVLDVAEAMNCLLARLAARKFSRSSHRTAYRQLLLDLNTRGVTLDAESFASIRRHFYRTLLETASNRELARHFSSINMQIVYVQFPKLQLQAIRVEDYLAICKEVMAGKAGPAETAARRHVKRVRELVTRLAVNAAASGSADEMLVNGVNALKRLPLD